MVLDQPVKPRTITRVAIHDRADQARPFQHQPFVDPARGVAENDVLAAVAFGKIARAEQVAARDFQLGCHLLRSKGRWPVAQGFGGDLGLIIKRGNKAKDRALMFNTFA